MSIVGAILGWITGTIFGVLRFIVKEIILLPFRIIRGIYRLVKRKREDKRYEEQLAAEIRARQEGLTPYRPAEPERLPDGEQHVVNIDEYRQFQEFQQFKAWQQQNSEAAKLERVQAAAAELQRVSGEVQAAKKSHRIPMAREDR